MTSTTNASFDKDTQAIDVATAFPDSIKDRTVLITGVNKGGIGYTTAEAFATQSPRCLILAGRSSAKIQECIDSLHSQYPAIDIRPLLIDLSSNNPSERRDYTPRLTDISAIDLLINNAGLMRHGESSNDPVPTNEDGIEEMFATNHLGHFLLTNLIMPKSSPLAQPESSTSAAPEHGSRPSAPAISAGRNQAPPCHRTNSPTLL